MLGIKIVFATPGHKTGMGLAERGNLLVGRWLKSYLSQNLTNWDEGLNFLLLQHRELVNATTGYSLSELVYDKNIRGGLCLARQVWENPERPKASDSCKKRCSEVHTGAQIEA